MAPKKSQSNANTSSKSSSSTTTTSSSMTTAPSSSATTTLKSSPSLSPKSSPFQIAQHIWTNYLQRTPPRTKLLDAFMAFLIVVGAIQFAYCVLAGNYPFNAFLSGFCASVGQFVLTASLRMQTVEKNLPLKPPSSSSSSAEKRKSEIQEKEGGGVSSERAFADFVFGSVILHAFCVNFIN